MTKYWPRNSFSWVVLVIAHTWIFAVTTTEAWLHSAAPSTSSTLRQQVAGKWWNVPHNTKCAQQYSVIQTRRAASILWRQPLYSSSSKNLLTVGSRLQMTKNADSGMESSSSSNQNRKYRFGRLGGRNNNKRRKRNQSQLMPNKTNRDNNKNGFPWWSIPTILLTIVLFKGVLFGHSWTDPSFVFYESSVYESSIYNSNGQVQSARKESFRSNIPSLVEQQRQQQQALRGTDGTATTFSFSSSSSSSLQQMEERLSAQEDAMVKEMDRMMRMQESILNQMF